MISEEALKSGAKKTALELKSNSKTYALKNMIERLDNNYNDIYTYADKLSKYHSSGFELVPGSAWLLDNFYRVEETVTTLERQLKKHQKMKLALVQEGLFKGYPRIYPAALKLIDLTSGSFDDRTITTYLEAYQNVSIFSISEIWLFNTMLILAVIEKIKYISSSILDHQAMKMKVKFLDLTEPIKATETVKYELHNLSEISPIYIEGLISEMRHSNTPCEPILVYLNDKLSQYGTTIEKMIHLAHDITASNNTIMGNLFTSLNQLSKINWNHIFESVSVVERILRLDPVEVYPNMTFKSRNYYRSSIEKLSKRHHLLETKIAHTALHLSTKNSSDKRKGHIGYYLIGKGQESLLSDLNIHPNLFQRLKFSPKLYIASICSATVLLTTLIALTIEFQISSRTLLLLIAFLISIPMAENIVKITHWILKKIYPIAFLPKLDLTSSIPEELSTFIVVPMLITSADRLKDLFKKLELYYLSNQSENLYFALLGEFKDCKQEISNDDQQIINNAIAEIKRLNTHYSPENPIFFYFQRKRLINSKQNNWMCWERKRGALSEFNNKMTGEKNTSHKIIYPSVEHLINRIKYVITLDEDTSLPLNAAHKLIGTIAHPLNDAVYDPVEHRVTDGYTVIQPNICIGFECSTSSRFTRIYARGSGMSIYIDGFADVYQDLFNDGIFMGKGIYNLRIFSEMLNPLIPHNRILSHDLLEGSFVNAAYVSDINLVDTHPPQYIPYLLRIHRWIRGDWQLIGWLRSKIPNSEGEKITNPLSILSKWKIFDNLRRSVYGSSLWIIMSLSILISPKAFTLALIFSSVSLILSFILEVIETDLYHKSYPPHKSYRKSRKIKFNLKGSFEYSLLQFMFLPFETYISIHAIFKSLYRLNISKMYLLEWQTAASLAQKSDHSLGYYLKKMKAVYFLVLPITLSSYLIHNSINILWLITSCIWLLSPFFAYYLEKDVKYTPELSLEDFTLLRKDARKIWGYYESLMTRRHHYLPPDNRQDHPPKGIAHRTSPTNIGIGLMSIISARDLGFITINRMVRMVSHTLQTTSHLEKWNGHLFNWYDTHTLSILRPAYISSVDSGNFIGYLITLKQSLNDCRNLPVIDDDMVRGLREYCEIMGVMNIEMNDKIKDFGEITGKTAHEWFEFLSSLMICAKKHPNCPDVIKKTLTELLDEHHRYYTLIKYDEDEENFDHPLYQKTLQKIEKIPMSMPLNDLRKYYTDILISIKRHKTHPSPDIINILEHKIMMIICNLDELLKHFSRLGNMIDRLVADTKFQTLYDFDKQLFAIGYDYENDQLSKSYYDYLASESRITSYLSIIEGQIPVEHWYHLNRSFVISKQYRALASWSGTMFEYFMPSLIIKNYDSSIFDETYQSVIALQKALGDSKELPWGVSESAYYHFDLDLNYQYKAFGVPNLGIKRGLVNEYVVSPYSTYFALPFDQKTALENLKKLRMDDTSGDLGLYESIDYTPNRLDESTNSRVVKTYMAHHMGMSLVAINNFLNKDIMQERFHSEPIVRTGEFLLKEKLPYRVSIVKKLKESRKESLEYRTKPLILTRTFMETQVPLPFCHILSNKSYHVMLTESGQGYSQWKDLFVTRFRQDHQLRFFGYSFYFRDIESGNYWSIGKEPCLDKPNQYEARFSLNKAEIVRIDHNISTHMEVFISPEDDVEIRRFTLINKNKHPVVLEVTSYAEMVINNLSDDRAHPAFNNLFVRTAFDSKTESLITSRRLREREEEICSFQTILLEGNEYGSIQHESDRSKFIGRGRNLSNPIALEKILDGTDGIVLDPISSLRKSVHLLPNERAVVTYVMGIGPSLDETYNLISKYQNSFTIHNQHELAEIQTQVVMQYLNLKLSDIQCFQDMASQLIYRCPSQYRKIDIPASTELGQDALWQFGISGDQPIILFILKSLEDNIDLLLLMKAKEYWKFKGVKIDLVIIDETKNSYRNEVREKVTELTLEQYGYSDQIEAMGIFVVNSAQIDSELRSLLILAANIIIESDKKSIKEQIELVQPDRKKTVQRSYHDYKLISHKKISTETQLKYFNGYGGFDIQNSSYVIRLKANAMTPAPWINVIANGSFGTIVSESGGGYTWAENSHQNKLTPWENDPLFDKPNDFIVAKDEAYGEIWSLTPKPLGQDIEYEITHGKGYSKYDSTAYGIKQLLTVFVPMTDQVKIQTIKIINLTDQKRTLSYFYSVKPVMGVHEDLNRSFIHSQLVNGQILVFENPYNHHYPNRLMYISSSEKIISHTSDEKILYGDIRDNIHKIDFLDNHSGANGLIQIQVELGPYDEKSINFILGQELSMDEVINKSNYYRSTATIETALSKVIHYWDKTLSVFQVHTPEPKFDVIMNGYLLYQSIACRLKARTAFYQTGGAFGYRDQLQDALNIVSICPSITKQQIILHAKHQFPEGDVLHWWHPGDIEKGVRTHYSDDLLWLPYAVLEYLQKTEDFSILELQLPYIEGEQIPIDQKDLYFTPSISTLKESLYLHCVRAIDHSLTFGDHGLPLIKGGDWNDGMNNIGRKGKGESVWLAWFLYHILTRFSQVALATNDQSNHIKFLNTADRILSAIENNGWDGSWYRRAYYDDGTPLGSIVNSECMITSLPQSWSVIAGGGNAERAKIAMNSVKNHLIIKDHGIVLLLTPPFEKTKKNPGYIKSYAKGLRENGGQYSHAATWIIMALAKLGEGDKAYEIFHMLNPITHSRSIFSANHYKVEPYVLAADLYNVNPHVGRGGWTWYTGSAAWLYRVGMESILGLYKEGDFLKINPCIPKTWQTYQMTYRFKNTLYTINIHNPDKLNSGKARLTMDGHPLDSNLIPLLDDCKEHIIEATLEKAVE